MSRLTPTVFVCGATGCQGGALARQLRQLGWGVHATTRDAHAPAAVALRSIGVLITEGDWDNTAALKIGLAGCDKVYLCLSPNWDVPAQEIRQAQNILDLAKSVGVMQVICSTTLGVAMLDGGVAVSSGSFMQRHMINKKSIETMVQDRNFQHFTLLRPTFFMANFLEPKFKRYTELRDEGSWTTAMTAETEFPIIDPEDIAKFAMLAFQNPAKYHGRALNLAGEQLRIQEMLDQLAHAAEKPGTLRAKFLTDAEVEAQERSGGFSNTHKSLRQTSEFVNLKELGSMVRLTSFEEFLEREKDAVLRTFSSKPN